MTKAFNLRQVLKVLGALLITESLFMLITAVVSFIYREDDFIPLLYSIGITCGTGLLGILAGRGSTLRFGIREGYLVVGLIWIIFSIFGMLPFVLSGYIPSVTDAFFETMSGFTTTGATILNNIESLPHGLLFWRSLTQWLGGMGIVVLSMAILPMFDAGMQLYSAEVTGPTHDKLLPRIKDTARRLWEIYILLTIIMTGLLYIAGMGFFDSVCHALSATSTGGYSTKQASVSYWTSPAIHYIIIIFMFVSGINYSLLYKVFIRGDIKKINKDDEFKTYYIVVAIVTTIIAAGLIFDRCIYSIGDIERNFRESLFQVVSIITTTGFVTTDYTLWAPVLQMTLLFLMFTGSCAGSTSGGVKLIRINIVLKNAFYEFKRVIHPKAVIPVRVNRHVLPESIVNGIYAFMTVFTIIIIGSTAVLMMCGLSISEAFGCVLTSISNIGPGLGSQGPSGSFASIPAFGKWYLAFLMLIGRLELFTILLLFSPTFWKK